MKNIIIFGSSSDLATEFTDILNKKKINFFSITQNKENTNNKNTLIVKDYEADIDLIYEFIKNIKNPYIFFFNGYLKENRPLYSPTNIEILQTFKINFFVPYVVINKIKDSNFEFQKITVISSIAATKPRLKNFIYGNTKTLLETYMKKSKIKKYSVIRFGYIYSKMSESHTPPPFAIDKQKAAKYIFNSLNGKKRLYVFPRILLFISILMKIAPSSILERLEK